MSNITDITALSDAALDVFLRVKGGEDGVTVTHLSPSERYAVCEALGIKRIPLGWLHDAPSGDVPRGPRTYDGFDYEGALLDEADERYGE